MQSIILVENHSSLRILIGSNVIRNTRVTRSSTRLLHPSLSPRVRISLNGPRNIIATRPVSNRRVISNHPTASFLSVGRTGLLENVARQLAGAQLNSADSRAPPSPSPLLCKLLPTPFQRLYLSPHQPDIPAVSRHSFRMAGPDRESRDPPRC